MAGNPLQYSSIANTLTGPQLTELTAKLRSATTTDQVNQLLNDTSIKRACCLRDPNSTRSSDTGPIPVKVKIPRPREVAIDDPTSQQAKYTYLEKIVSVDSALCNTAKYQQYQRGTPMCDDFYQAYCDNLRQDFQALLCFLLQPQLFLCILLRCMHQTLLYMSIEL